MAKKVTVKTATLYNVRRFSVDASIVEGEPNQVGATVEVEMSDEVASDMVFAILKHFNVGTVHHSFLMRALTEDRLAEIEAAADTHL